MGEVIWLSFGPVTSEKVVGDLVVLAAEVMASAQGLVETTNGRWTSKSLILLRRLRRSLRPLAEESRRAALRLSPSKRGSRAMVNDGIARWMDISMTTAAAKICIDM